MPFDQVFANLVQELNSAVIPQSIQYAIFVAPIFLAAALIGIFWPLWVRYVRARYILTQKHVLLEIKLPKETFKSPLAMELFLTSLYQTGGEGTWYAKYWLGQTRPWFSLEMASVEGVVKLYIWMRHSSRNFVESSLYAQFPGVEVRESDDYARSVHFDPAEMGVWGMEVNFTKDRAYPIKTYVDYGLDKDPKEEFKVDPLAPLLEFLGSVGPNQQIWIQIPIRARKDDQIKPGHLFKTTNLYKDEARKLINDLMKRDPDTLVTGEEDEDSGLSKKPTLTKGEQEIIGSIERNLHKQAFDCGIRAVYIAKEGFFNPSYIGGIIGSWKQFSSEELNGFKPNSKKWHMQFDYPWQDYRDIRRNRQSRRLIAAYKRRSFFYAPYEADKQLILSTEELATLFHFPGQVAGTPTLERIPSKKSQAPANLPI